MPNPPYIQNPQCLPLRKPIASVDESIEEDNSSCVIGWESQTREVKQELLNNKIEEKRSQRSNYHRKLKRLQVGDIVTAKVGKSYKKPNGKNTLRMPMFGNIIKSMSNNEYDVEFVNNTTKTLKSSQLSKPKNPDIYFKLTQNEPHVTTSSLQIIDNNDTTTCDDGAAINEFSNEDDKGDIAEDDADGDTHSHVSISVAEADSKKKEKEALDRKHRKNYNDALDRIKSEEGRKVTVKSSKGQLTWTFIDDVAILQKQPTRSNNRLGIRELNTQKLIEDSPLPLAELFLRLLFRDGEWERSLVQMNKVIQDHNNILERRIHNESDTPSSSSIVRPFTKKEFLCGIALIVGAADCSDKGEVLWVAHSKGKKEEERHWSTICEKTDFGKYMRLYRFKQFRTFFPKIWEEEQHRCTDPWWKFSRAVDDFNAIRKEMILPCEIISLDESMSAFRPQTTKTGGLPNISYIARKPENLGTELKTGVCPVLGVMMFLEIQRGKGEMTGHKYFRDIGATASCTLRIAEGVSHKHIDCLQEVVLGDSWFGSVKAAGALANEGFECILQIKQNHAQYPKQAITDILKDAPGGTKVVMTTTNSMGVELIATGYKYNKKSILFFVSTPGAGSTVDREPYEMKFVDEYANIHIREVPRPALISYFFQHVNAVDVHNHLRQSSLRLEKKWVTFDPYFRLATTLLGINVVDTYRLARFHNMLPRGKMRLNKDYEKDFDEDDENGFTMKRFAGVLSTQLLYMAESYKVETFYVDDDGNIQSRVNELGKKSIDACKRKSVDLDDDNIDESLGTRWKVVGKARGRKTLKSSKVAKKKRKEPETRGFDRVDVNTSSKKRRVGRDMDMDMGVYGKNMVDTTVMFWRGDEDDNRIRTNNSMSSVSCGISEQLENRILETFQDFSGNTHTVMKLESTVSGGKKTKGKSYVKPRQCLTCTKRCRTMCYECNEVHCFPIKKCILVEDSCFVAHMNRPMSTRAMRNKMFK